MDSQVIAKHGKNGSGFGGILRYLLLAKDRSPRLGASLLSSDSGMDGRTPEALAQHMHQTANLRPSVEKPVAHFSLSFHSEEKLTDQQMLTIASKYMERMGYIDCPFAIVRHGDTRNPHIHVVCSRVRYDGSLVTDRMEHRRANRVSASLEKAFGLQKTNHAKPKVTAYEKVRRTADKRYSHVTADAKYLGERIDLALVSYLEQAAHEGREFKFRFESFAEHCHAAGIEAIPNKAAHGSIRGCSFRPLAPVGGEYRRALSGGRIRRDLTWGAIRKRFSAAELRGRRLSEMPGVAEKLARELKVAGFSATEKTDYGFRLRSGNWQATVTDRRDSLVIRGVPDQKLAALIAIKSAAEKGWSSISINTKDEALKQSLEELASSSGIAIQIQKAGGIQR